MRREFIYPHRSVRSFPITRLRFFLALVMALLLTFLICYFSSSLLEVHSQLSGFILKHSGIPITSVQAISLFPVFGLTNAANISIPNQSTIYLRSVCIFSGLIIVMLLIHRTIPISRNFIIFLTFLLFSTVAAIILFPSFYYNSVAFMQIWLRVEILVWIILPWISALLFLLTIPSLTGGLVWAILLQIYAVVCSAIRLSFCLGVFHYTGILFLPLLWFCFGILFDLVYILVFYGISLRLSMNLVMGKRVV
jgi:hypothetical protein